MGWGADRGSRGAGEQGAAESGRPGEGARRWADQGAERIHVVDLDGARAGEPVNTDVVRRIVDAVDVPVQLGGGIRAVASAREAVAWGVDRVMVGTAALRTPLSESKQLYHALKRRRIPTAMVTIPGAYHNISNRPSQLIAKVRHTLAWFKRYDERETSE